MCSFSELALSGSVLVTYLGVRVREILPLLMYDTTKTLPSNAVSVSKALFTLSSLRAALKVLPS